MPAALDQISYVVVGYAGLVLLVALYSAYRWRARPPWLDSMAWMLEFLLAVRAVAGAGALLSGDRPDSLATHVGYLVASVCVVPIALSSVRDDESTWSVGVLAVAALAVGVISVRIMTTL
jgi:threonine/homoserine efflux transporter RhtA